uniref:Uncharacterized protein n=1 Tax=Onchocerca volvulus TaxID=6282 RepID=A0A8R1TNR1_ONCVO
MTRGSRGFGGAGDSGERVGNPKMAHICTITSMNFIPPLCNEMEQFWEKDERRKETLVVILLRKHELSSRKPPSPPPPPPLTLLLLATAQFSMIIIAIEQQNDIYKV